MDTNAGLRWLHRLAVESPFKEVPHSALFALGRHGNPGATNQLADIALTEGVDVAEQAVFWLGEARGVSGYEALVRLLADLPVGEARRAIPFALSLNDTPAAVDKLEALAMNAKDREVRGQSMFWLAESYPERAEPIVMAVIRDEPQPRPAE